jgi:hypothetical protein
MVFSSTRPQGSAQNVAAEPPQAIAASTAHRSPSLQEFAMAVTNIFDPFDMLGRFGGGVSVPVTQDIRPVWFPTTITFAGSAPVETRVVSDVASYGRQLGLITEVVLALAEQASLSPEASRSRDRLAGIAKRIETVKKAVGGEPRAEAELALDRLERADPQGYSALLKRRSGPKSSG